jgi:hypothetical protein
MTSLTTLSAISGLDNPPSQHDAAAHHARHHFAVRPYPRGRRAARWLAAAASLATVAALAVGFQRIDAGPDAAGGRPVLLACRP